MQASLHETPDVECGDNAGHWDGILLSEFKPRNLPEKYRSQRNWALIRMKAILVVKLIVTNATGGSECCGSGCITDLHNSDNGSIKLTVRTVAHLGYDKDKASRTTLRVFIPDTDLVLESRNVKLQELLESHRVDDIAMLYVIFDRNSFTHLENGDILNDIRNALMTNTDTLFELVLRKYQTVKFPLPSFLKYEINCLKDIKFSSGKAWDLEIQIQVENLYVIDVILFMFGFASHPGDLRELLGKIAARSNLNTAPPCSPVTVVSKQIFTDQFGTLNKLLTSLCKPLTGQAVREVNCYISRLFPFNTDIKLTKSNVMTMLVGSTPLSEQKSEEVGVGTGQALQLLGGNSKAKRKVKEMTGLGDFKPNDSEEINKQTWKLQDGNTKYETKIKEQDTELTDVGLDANKMKEEHDSRVSCLDSRRTKQGRGKNNTITTFKGDGYEGEKEADLSLVTNVKQNKRPIEGNKNEETLAGLISYPRGNEPQRITFGDVKRYEDKEVFYITTPCSGRSGGLICLIPGKPGTELEDIRFATHSTCTDEGAMRVAVRGAGLAWKGIGSATASAAVEDEGVGVQFKFQDKQI